jgi:hypothetical protein
MEHCRDQCVNNNCVSTGVCVCVCVCVCAVGDNMSTRQHKPCLIVINIIYDPENLNTCPQIAVLN